jgi:hypothetical protein
MAIQEIKHETIWVAIGAFLAGCAEYFVHHPLTAITSVIMLLITWERYRKSRISNREAVARAKKAETEEQMARQKQEDWIRRFEENKKEQEDAKETP